MKTTRSRICRFARVKKAIRLLMLWTKHRLPLVLLELPVHLKCMCLKQASGQFILEYMGSIDDSPQDGGSAQRRYVEEAVNSLLNGSSCPVSDYQANWLCYKVEVERDEERLTN